MTLFLEVAFVVLAAVGVAVCLALLPGPPPSHKRLEPTGPRPRSEQIVHLERLVAVSQESALQVHAYLRPLLAEIASRRLAARGQSLTRMSQAVGRERLGEPLWELVRPDRPFPEDRYGPGVPPEDLAQMVAVLERL